MARIGQCYGLGQGTLPLMPPPIPFENPPTANQTNYDIGQVVYTPPNDATAFYMYAGAGNWQLLTTSAYSGVTAAMAGTPGAVTVSNPLVTASSVIIYSRATTGGTPGQVSITAQSSGSFTLTSTGNETSTFNYLVL